MPRPVLLIDHAATLLDCAQALYARANWTHPYRDARTLHGRAARNARSNPNGHGNDRGCRYSCYKSVRAHTLAHVR